MGAIYRVTNKVNGRVYIGQTTKKGWKQRYQGIGSRIEMLKRKGEILRPIDRAMAKHGVENFEFCDLVTNVPDRLLDCLERLFIRQFRSDDGEHGYNADGGGQATKDLSDATRAKLRKHGVTVTTWSHPVHGIHVCGVSELVRKFPEQRLVACGLSHVRRGRARVYKGWVQAGVKSGFMPEKFGRVHLWVHPQAGQFLGTTSMLAKRFLRSRFGRQSVSYCIGDPRRSHRKWKWIRAGTFEEQQKCCEAGEV